MDAGGGGGPSSPEQCGRMPRRRAGGRQYFAAARGGTNHIRRSLADAKAGEYACGPQSGPLDGGRVRAGDRREAVDGGADIGKRIDAKRSESRMGPQAGGPQPTAQTNHTPPAGRRPQPPGPRPTTDPKAGPARQPGPSLDDQGDAEAGRGRGGLGGVLDPGPRSPRRRSRSRDHHQVVTYSASLACTNRRACA